MSSHMVDLSANANCLFQHIDLRSSFCIVRGSHESSMKSFPIVPTEQKCLQSVAGLWQNCPVMERSWNERSRLQTTGPDVAIVFVLCCPDSVCTLAVLSSNCRVSSEHLHRGRGSLLNDCTSHIQSRCCVLHLFCRCFQDSTAAWKLCGNIAYVHRKLRFTCMASHFFSIFHVRVPTPALNSRLALKQPSLLKYSKVPLTVFGNKKKSLKSLELAREPIRRPTEAD